MTNFCLTVTCPSQRGIVAAISTYIAEQGCNITDSAQFDDADNGQFFMRINATAETGAALEDLCHCTLFNQILRIQRILGRFCTLNSNISTGSTPQDLTSPELFQIASARVRSASRFAPTPSSDMA